MDQKYKKEKRVFEKHKQKLYKNEKEILFNFFKIEFWPKKRPLRDAARPKKQGPCGKPHGKKKVFEKHKQGAHEKGLRQRDEKKGHGWSLKVLDGHFLHPKGMGAWLMAPP